MKYIIMENNKSYSVAMDENGLFYRVANLGYDIGDVVIEPVFMKSPEHTKKINWKKISTIAAIFVCIMLAGVPFINNNAEKDIVVYMSINPEIHMEINEKGNIRKIVADNYDGKVLLDGYEYEGKSVSTVLIELIERAKKLKYLSDGGDVCITVEATDEYKAKNVKVDLSQALDKTYNKKYKIKIKANKEEFNEPDAILASEETMLPVETEQMSYESETAGSYSYGTENSVETTVSTTEITSEHTTAATTESKKSELQSTETSKPTEISKPTETSKATEISDPTEISTDKQTEIIEPTELPVEGTNSPMNPIEVPTTEANESVGF